MIKVDYLGNIYFSKQLTDLELHYLDIYSKSYHFENDNDENFGLFWISCEHHTKFTEQTLFNEKINEDKLTNEQYISSNKNGMKNTTIQNDPVFPFVKSLVFTKKNVKFNMTHVSDVTDFLSIIKRIVTSIQFYENYFLSNNNIAKILMPNYFHFFQENSLSGKIYFKLNSYGLMFKLVIAEGKISLYQGKYPVIIKKQEFFIDSQSDEQYKNELKIYKQLKSTYEKITVIDIKNNAIFDEIGTDFHFVIPSKIEKLLQYKKLDQRLLPKTKEKLNKI